MLENWFVKFFFVVLFLFVCFFKYNLLSKNIQGLSQNCLSFVSIISIVLITFAVQVLQRLFSWLYIVSSHHIYYFFKPCFVSLAFMLWFLFNYHVTPFFSAVVSPSESFFSLSYHNCALIKAKQPTQSHAYKKGHNLSTSIQFKYEELVFSFDLSSKDTINVNTPNTILRAKYIHTVKEQCV